MRFFRVVITYIDNQVRTNKILTRAERRRVEGIILLCYDDQGLLCDKGVRVRGGGVISSRLKIGSVTIANEKTLI